MTQKSLSSPILKEENKEGELCEKKEVNTYERKVRPDVGLASCSQA